MEAPRILVVDDEPDLENVVRLKFRKRIRSGELEFVFARDGREALERIDRGPAIDLLLTDLKMPRMDGLTLLSAVTERDLPLKAIVVTAYGDMPNIRKAMNQGAFDFLSKPLDLDDFEVTIDNALAAIAADRAREQEEDRLRRRIAQDLHDEMGGDLSSITLMSEMAVSGLPDAHPARRTFADIGHTSRKLVADLRDIVWLVDPDYDQLDNMVHKMEEVAETMLADTSFTFDCPDHAFSGTVDMDFRRHVFLIYKEVLHNIMRHARAGKVQIDVLEDDDALVLRVSDDGIGFDRGAVRIGSGLKSLEARASHIGGSVKVDSRPGEGTIVTLTAQKC